MSLFRRAMGWLFFLFGLFAGLVGAATVAMVRRMVAPPRQKPWASPADLGMTFEDVQFPSADGLRLSGWFIPALERQGPQEGSVVLVHGWGWNRLGEDAEDPLNKMAGTAAVDLLRLAHSLHNSGLDVLMFDLRNHGRSAPAPPVTFGWSESDDVIGAVEYLAAREDVEPGRIGVIGLSMGANAVLYALAKSDRIKAAVAIQPATIAEFASRFTADLLGPLAKITLPVAEFLYRRAGGPALSAIQPAAMAANSGHTPVLFIQGDGDKWGSVEDVTQMAAACPRAYGPLIVEAADRFSGYQYSIDHPKIVSSFLQQHLAA